MLPRYYKATGADCRQVAANHDGEIIFLATESLGKAQPDTGVLTRWVIDLFFALICLQAAISS